MRRQLGPEARGEEKERKYIILIRFWGLGERRELSQRGPRRSSGQINGIVVIQSPQIASVDSRWQQILHLFRFSSWKVRGTVPLSPKSGVPVPSYASKLRHMVSSTINQLSSSTKWTLAVLNKYEYRPMCMQLKLFYLAITMHLKLQYITINVYLDKQSLS